MFQRVLLNTLGQTTLGLNHGHDPIIIMPVIFVCGINGKRWFPCIGNGVRRTQASLNFLPVGCFGRNQAQHPALHRVDADGKNDLGLMLFKQFLSYLLSQPKLHAIPKVVDGKLLHIKWLLITHIRINLDNYEINKIKRRSKIGRIQVFQHPIPIASCGSFGRGSRSTLAIEARGTPVAPIVGVQV